jgi:hypothetical protein
MDTAKDGNGTAGAHARALVGAGLGDCNRRATEFRRIAVGLRGGSGWGGCSATTEAIA